MADYNWGLRDHEYWPLVPSDEETYAEGNGFEVYHHDEDTDWKNRIRTHRAETVYCEFCGCSIWPLVVYMRVHRRKCNDERIAGKHRA